VVKGAQQAVVLQGLPEMNLENVTMTDMLLEAENGFSIVDAQNIKIENVELKTKNKTGIEFYNSRDVKIENLKFDFDASNSITVNGIESNNISILPVDGILLEKYTTVGEEVEKGTVKFY
jgi:polygalacturonase